MGMCVSTSSAGAAAIEAAAPAETALVLLPTGELRDYPRPTTAARVLEDADVGGSCEEMVLCDSDRMGFEGPVAAVGGGEELRAGRIYFVLPAAARRLGLRREEVAALAVKASAALASRAQSGTGRRRRGGAAVAPVVFSPSTEGEDEVVETLVAAPKAVGKPRPRRPQRRFAPDLTAIPECDNGTE